VLSCIEQAALVYIYMGAMYPGNTTRTQYRVMTRYSLGDIEFYLQQTRYRVHNRVRESITELDSNSVYGYTRVNFHILTLKRGDQSQPWTSPTRRRRCGDALGRQGNKAEYNSEIKHTFL
jgi:hypothetical protein